MQVAKRGNSLAIRIPASVVDALSLKPGDEAEVKVADQRELRLLRKPGKEDHLTRLRAMRGLLRADFVFDRDEARAR